MEKKELLKKIAPCGLLCYTCTAARDGAIQSLSKALLTLLESFDSYAERFSAFEPTMKKYPDFKEVLLLFSTASCEGCRGGKCVFPNCSISPCIEEKEHSFCFECEGFPCDKADFDPNLREKWLRSNNRMKEIGVEAYFSEVKDRSHYS